VLKRESIREVTASIRSLVGVSARGCALTTAYCRKFIASALPAGLLALCVLSLYLVTGGHPSFWGALAFLGVGIAMIYVARPVLTPQRAQHQSEQVSEKSEGRYRLLAECANDMITVHDRRGQVMFASQAAQQLLGATAPNVLGGGLLEHVHVGDRPAYLSALNRCSADDEPTSVELRLRRDASDGEPGYVWVEMRSQPMPKTSSWGDSAVVTVTRDVSQYKEYEADLLRARGEAEGANRAKSQFLASMSHELRTPLNAIIGFSEILERELFGQLGEERYRDYAGLIHESGEHLLSVVNGILDMSKIEAGKFTIVREPFCVASLVESCCDILRHTAETKGLALKVELDDNQGELAADKRACKQMLLNVISNALKFTEAGGQVTVSAKVSDNNMVFTVSDNGIGIPEKDLPRLGNPFVQAASCYDRSHEGAGLGLSVVQGLAKLHGGSLKLESTLGEGTTARIILPLVQRTEATPEEKLGGSAAAA
jgi:cell cycle sensor histidine kinase DivJ